MPESMYMYICTCTLYLQILAVTENVNSYLENLENKSSACRSIICPKDEPFAKLVMKTLLECNLCIYMFIYCKTLPKDCSKVKVTFTFDLLTSKSIWIIYGPWPTKKSIMMYHLAIIIITIITM